MEAAPAHCSACYAGPLAGRSHPTPQSMWGASRGLSAASTTPAARAARWSRSWASAGRWCGTRGSQTRGSAGRAAAGGPRHLHSVGARERALVPGRVQLGLQGAPLFQPHSAHTHPASRLTLKVVAAVGCDHPRRAPVDVCLLPLLRKVAVPASPGMPARHVHGRVGTGSDAPPHAATRTRSTRSRHPPSRNTRTRSLVPTAPPCPSCHT